MINRRHRACAALLLSIGALSAPAFGQQAAGGAGAAPTTPAAPATPAPVTLSQGAYQTPSANKVEIEAFVKANVDALANEADPAAQSKSRENLTAATVTAGAPASPEFLLEYGRALNSALSDKLDVKNKPALRTRLNIAIVAAKVAYMANNITLSEVALKLVNDPAEPVVLWGLKVAQPLIPQAVKLRFGNAVPPLVTAIVPAVAKHPSGAVIDEAYAALSGTNDPAVVGELMRIWQNRLEQYRKDIPEDPAIDGKPVFTLTTKEAWSGVLKDPKMQAGVMQMIADQIFLAATYADKTPAGDQHDQLVKLVQQCAAGCFVVGGHQSKPALAAAASAAANMRPETLPQGTKVLPMVSPALTGQIVTAFPTVKLPAAVAGGAPAATTPQQP